MSDIDPPAADAPAHYTLSAETWALILKEYVEGATAPFLARKWRVSENALRKRAGRERMTKRDQGDAEAIRQATERAAEVEALRGASPRAVAARLFRGLDLDDDEGDPGALARTALLVSGRAMRGRLWSEARHLAGLAESYARLNGLGLMAGGDGGRSPQDAAALAYVLERLAAEDRAGAGDAEDESRL